MTADPALTRRTAAFFDVDGTVVDSTIVHYYAYFRRSRLSPLTGHLWHAAFLVKCLYFLVLDRFDRSLFNVVFYRQYGGLPAAAIKAQADDCYREVIAPRRFREAADCVADHLRADRVVVLVTGSIDFLMAPLAQDLSAHHVLAPALVESNGRFTGELDGRPVGEMEKARRIRNFAELHGIDLARSYAYGDSIADLEMLESVGLPHAVNPDRALRSTALRRGWPVLQWSHTPRSQSNGR